MLALPHCAIGRLHVSRGRSGAVGVGLLSLREAGSPCSLVGEGISEKQVLRVRFAVAVD